MPKNDRESLETRAKREKSGGRSKAVANCESALASHLESSFASSLVWRAARSASGERRRSTPNPFADSPRSAPNKSSSADSPLAKRESEFVGSELRAISEELKDFLAKNSREHSFFSMAEDYFILSRDCEYRARTPRATSKEVFIESLRRSLLRSPKSISKRLDRLRALTTPQRELFFFFLKRFPRQSISRKAVFASKGDMFNVRLISGQRISQEERAFLREAEARLRVAVVPRDELLLEWVLGGAKPAPRAKREAPPATPQTEPLCLGRACGPTRGRGPVLLKETRNSALNELLERVEAIDEMIAKLGKNVSGVGNTLNVLFGTSPPPFKHSTPR